MKDSTRMRDCFKMGKCRRYALSIIVLSLLISVFSAIGTAQASQQVSPLQASNVKTKNLRKATLQELYAMFFTYAIHVETVSNADEKDGKDRTFYRQHLQVDSSLTVEEYALVLDSARRFVAVDTDAKEQIYKLLQSNGNANQINSLLGESISSLKEEIDYLRRVLGQDRADELDAYLQTNYQKTTISSDAYKSSVSSLLLKNQGTMLAGSTPQASGSGQDISQSQIVATPSNVTIDGGTTCGTVVDAFGNTFDICVDSQMSYKGPGNLVEVYSFGYVNYTLYVGSMACTTEVGNLYINGSATNVSCVPTQTGVPCSMNTPFSSIAKYAWDTTETIYYTIDGIGGCYGSNWARMHYPTPPSVIISNVVIDHISPYEFSPGDKGTMTIYGANLWSPFENTPQVSDQMGYFSFSNLSVQPVTGGTEDITVNYVVSTNASTLNGDGVIVNNGFQQSSKAITINPPAPTITSSTVVGSSTNALQAGTTVQTVILAGQNFGSSAPTITIASGGSGVTIGAITAYSQTSVSFQVTVASDTSAGTVQFELYANDSAQNHDALSQVLSIVAMVPPAITINFNGTNITDGSGSSPTSVVVGQQIYLSISLANGDDPSTIATSIDWTVPGVVIGDYAVSSDHASAQVIPLTQTEQPTIVFFWVSTGGNASASFTVQYTYCVDVDMKSCATATASFVVSGPTNATMTATPGPAELMNATVDNFTGPVLYFGDNSGLSGMTFTAQMTFPNAIPQEDQAAFFVQLVNYDNLKYVSQSGSVTSCTGPASAPALDSRYPVNNLTAMSTDDVPTVPLFDDNWIPYVEGKRTFSATMYLMTPPPSTACNAPTNLGVSCYVPVPLGSTTWNFNGDAINTLQVQNVVNAGASTKNNTTFVLNSCSGCTSSSPQFVSSDPIPPNYGYPTWTAKSLMCDAVASTE